MLEQEESRNHDHKNTLKFEKSTDFFEYLQLKQYSNNHMVHLTNYYKKHLEGKVFHNPLKLEKYVKSQATGQNNIIRAARSYLNYCEKIESIPIETINKYRKFLKLKRSRADVSRESLIFSLF